MRSYHRKKLITDIFAIADEIKQKIPPGTYKDRSVARKYIGCTKVPVAILYLPKA